MLVSHSGQEKWKWLCLQENLLLSHPVLYKGPCWVNRTLISQQWAGKVEQRCTRPFPAVPAKEKVGLWPCRMWESDMFSYPLFLRYENEMQATMVLETYCVVSCPICNSRKDIGLWVERPEFLFWLCVLLACDLWQLTQCLWEFSHL